MYNDGLICAVGKPYLVAVETQRTQDAATSEWTTHYCSGSVYQCSGTGSFGFQCQGGDTFLCTWPAGQEPTLSNVTQNHKVVTVVGNPHNGYVANKCVIDDQPRFDAMHVNAQRLAGGIGGLFALAISCFVCLIGAITGTRR